MQYFFFPNKAEYLFCATKKGGKLLKYWSPKLEKYHPVHSLLKKTKKAKEILEEEQNKKLKSTYNYQNTFWYMFSS